MGRAQNTVKRGTFWRYRRVGGRGRGPSLLRRGEKRRSAMPRPGGPWPDLRAAAPAADPGKRGKEEGPRATVEWTLDMFAQQMKPSHWSVEHCSGFRSQNKKWLKHWSYNILSGDSSDMSNSHCPLPPGVSRCYWRQQVPPWRVCADARCSSQTPFLKYSRNSKTLPNFVPNMTQNQSQ